MLCGFFLFFPAWYGRRLQNPRLVEFQPPCQLIPEGRNGNAVHMPLVLVDLVKLYIPAFDLSTDWLVVKDKDCPETCRKKIEEGGQTSGTPAFRRVRQEGIKTTYTHERDPPGCCASNPQTAKPFHWKRPRRRRPTPALAATQGCPPLGSAQAAGPRPRPW